MNKKDWFKVIRRYRHNTISKEEREKYIDDKEVGSTYILVKNSSYSARQNVLCILEGEVLEKWRVRYLDTGATVTLDKSSVVLVPVLDWGRGDASFYSWLQRKIKVAGQFIEAAEEILKQLKNQTP